MLLNQVPGFVFQRVMTFKLHSYRDSEPLNTFLCANIKQQNILYLRCQSCPEVVPPRKPAKHLQTQAVYIVIPPLFSLKRQRCNIKRFFTAFRKKKN